MGRVTTPVSVSLPTPTYPLSDKKALCAQQRFSEHRHEPDPDPLTSESQAMGVLISLSWSCLGFPMEQVAGLRMLGVGKQTLRLPPSPVSPQPHRGQTLL